ncbi:MAG: hypothetical protein QOD09_3247 [Bradyrhizobium sp.]|jgi:hypothetical protein|nr:hypothetical protein [Bradyrhizobium sp.]
MSLREALENALEGKLDDVRMLIRALLDQNIREPEPLVEECQRAIFG